MSKSICCAALLVVAISRPVHAYNDDPTSVGAADNRTDPDIDQFADDGENGRLLGRELTPAEAEALVEAAAEQGSEGQSDRLAKLGLVNGMVPTDKAITVFRKRVEENPQDVLGFTMLGRLYLRFAKENDDLSAYQQAEDALRRAVEINTSYLPAKTHFAIALQARHRFAEALELASEAFVKNPANTLALATIGDCRLQLGQYEDARKVYDALAQQSKSAPVLARLAHLQELHGQPQEAVRLLEQAWQQAEASDVSADSIAWYHLRLADLHFAQGDLEGASKHFEFALQLVPHYAPAMSGWASVQAARGELDAAESTLRSAVELHGEPPMMAALGDVLTKRGDTSEAAEWYRKADEAMAEEALTAAAAHYREVAMFYADHDMQPQRALELAWQDMRLRQDIYAHDTLAWALYRNGQFENARKASREALRLGTDASLHFHAGMIHAGLNNHKEAAAALKTALEINPNFSVLLSDVARAKLAELQW